jgi:hypothetical protein
MLKFSLTSLSPSMKTGEAKQLAAASAAAAQVFILSSHGYIIPIPYFIAGMPGWEFFELYIQFKCWHDKEDQVGIQYIHSACLFSLVQTWQIYPATLVRWSKMPPHSSTPPSIYLPICCSSRHKLHSIPFPPSNVSLKMRSASIGSGGAAGRSGWH